MWPYAVVFSDTILHANRNASKRHPYLYHSLGFRRPTDVAEILEQKYHVMAPFYAELEALISEALTSAMGDALETVSGHFVMEGNPARRAITAPTTAQRP
jgi:hypothetical protein